MITLKYKLIIGLIKESLKIIKQKFHDAPEVTTFRPQTTIRTKNSTKLNKLYSNYDKNISILIKLECGYPADSIYKKIYYKNR